MIIEKLDWDSEFFGIKIGRLIIGGEPGFDPSRFIQQARDDKYELVYVFKFNEMLPWKMTLESELELADIQLTMSKKFVATDYKSFPYDFRTELTSEEKEACHHIAEEISTVSRFYNEEKIGRNKTKAMYREWVDNALNGTFCDGLFLIRDDNEIVGIHLIKTDNPGKVGNCSMIGVSHAFRNKHIGENLWEQAYGYWANECDVEMCRVPFSFQNEASFNFHLKMGFNKIEETKYIYHYRSQI